MGPRLERQIPTAGGVKGAAGITGAAGAAGTVGNTGTADTVHGTACDDAGDVAGATDGSTAAGGDAGAIPGEDRQPSGRRGPPGQQYPSTGADTSGNEGVQATDTARPPDHALFNQHTSALPTCDASQLSEPSTYDEAMRSPYRANWSHAIKREISGLEEAGTLEDTKQQKDGNMVSTTWVYTWKSDETGKEVKAKA